MIIFSSSGWEMTICMVVGLDMVVYNLRFSEFLRRVVWWL